MFAFLAHPAYWKKAIISITQPMSMCLSVCLCLCFASSSGCLLDQQRVWFNWVCSTVICTAKPALNAVSLETHTAPGMDTLAALTCQLRAGDTHLTLVWAACLIESIISAVSCTLKPESIGMWDIWNKSDLKHSSLSAEETFVRLTMTATRWTSVSVREVRDTGDQTFTIAEHSCFGTALSIYVHNTFN